MTADTRSDHDDSARHTDGRHADTRPPVLSARHLRVDFDVRTDRGRGVVHAVQDVSFDLYAGQALGLVGESGSGKSTIANALMRLVEPTSGTVRLGDLDVTSLPASRLRALRRRMAMVFQDPFSALDPRQSIGRSISEPLVVHRLAGGAARRRGRVRELLELVDLPADFADRFPHELSGGQRQRVCVARALAGEPEILILDEATASLDVSVQANIMNLLRRLQRELGLAYLFVSHDLAAVDYMSDQVLVLYLGRTMEISAARDIYRDPRHPYTRALMSAIPDDDPVRQRKRERIVLAGEVPSPMAPPSGCVFRTRCPEVIDACAETIPEPVQVGPGHTAACIRVAAAATHAGAQR